MSNKSRFYIAENKIQNFFSSGPKNVYSRSQLNTAFEEKRREWNLPVSMTIDKFIEKILKEKILKRKILKFEGYFNDKEIYLNNDATIFQVASSIINKSYLSHYTALYLNGLTTQIPKTIYVTSEQSKKEIKNQQLEQKTIDAAFSKPQRKSETFALYNKYVIQIHNGKYTNRIGTYLLDDIPVTNIERTLIDITVRPNYAGGIYSVLEAYVKARDKISINKLNAILESIDYIYPYHQCIGFLLEKAGFEIKKLDVLRKKEMKFDFYLTYNILEKEYSKEWKIYYPKGL